MVELREEGRKKLCVVVLKRIVRLSYHMGTPRTVPLLIEKDEKTMGGILDMEKWFLNNAMLVVAFRCKKYISSSSC